MIIYSANLTGTWECHEYFFTKEDAERQIEKWKALSHFWEVQDDFFVEEIFVHGNNPFCNNQELID